MKKILEKIKNQYLIETIFTVIMIIILIYTLFINPIVGKCDNGDFERMFGQAGLVDFGKNYSERYDGTVHRYYKINIATLFLPWWQNWVLGVVITKISVVLYSFISIFNGGKFNISMQALVYCILFVTAFFMILKSKRLSKPMKIAAGILGIIFFTDINYIAYFNSFFGEAAVITFMFLFIASTLNLVSRKEPRKIDFIIFFICSGGFIVSKTQEVPLLVFMLIIYGVLYLYYKDKRKLILKSTAIITALSIVMLLSISKFTNMNNMYQAVFMGILKDSETPEKDLEDLGLNKELVYLKDYGFYDDTNPVDRTGDYLKENFYNKMSSVKVLKFYLTHPKRMWEKMTVSAENAYDFHDIGKGNFEKGKYPNNKKVNTLRYKLVKSFPNLHRNINIYLIFSAIYFAICIYYLFKKNKETKIISLMCIFILAAGSSQSILPIIGSGQADFGKHLFLLNLSYDVMIIISLLWIVNLISNIVKRIKQ